MEAELKNVNVNNDDGFVLVQSPLISVTSDRSASMGRDAVLECAGVEAEEPGDRLFEEGQRRLREMGDSPGPLSTEKWIFQAMAAVNMSPCKLYILIHKSLNNEHVLNCFG